MCKFGDADCILCGVILKYLFAFCIMFWRVYKIFMVCAVQCQMCVRCHVLESRFSICHSCHVVVSVVVDE